MSGNARALALALLCVLAVSLGAATLGDTTSQSAHGSDDATRTSSDQPTFARGDPALLSPPTVLATAALLLLVAFAAAWGLYRERGVFAASVAFVVVLGVGVLCWLLLVELGGLFEYQRPELPGISAPSPPSLPESVAGGGENSESFRSLSTVVGAAVLVAVLVAAWYLAGGDRRDEATDSADKEASGHEDGVALAAVGAAAGEAADRLDEDADLENEVYRAWRDMTTHLDARRPRTSTPAEFAAAAADAGMDETHVETLTELFRDVRYGGVDATPDREERAVESLRAIESRYAD